MGHESEFLRKYKNSTRNNEKSCHHRRGIFEFIFVSTNSTGRKDTRLLLIDNGGVETLGLLNVDGLDVRVELLLGTLLVVTFPCKRTDISLSPPRSHKATTDAQA